MRLQLLSKGHQPSQKLKLFIMRLIIGITPGPIATLSYRKDFFGLQFSRWIERSMRQLRHWSFGEAELFSAYVSKLNHSQFFLDAHAELAKISLPSDYVDSALADPDKLSSRKMRAVFSLIKKLTLNPDHLSVQDFNELIRLKVESEAIKEIIHICSVFTVVNRLDLAFNYPPLPRLDKIAKFLLYNGYKRAVV
ncbi:MAG: hypothetical protein KDD94_03530 [Calditrichaeota bacterium]|nr:hypothetical protein [Calditrichota bacterium]